MFDINFNFSECFKFFLKNQRNDEINISNFINSLKFHDSKTRVSLILQKILNSKNDLVILLKNNENRCFNIMDVVGDFSLTRTNYFNTLTIPIYINIHLECFFYWKKKQCLFLSSFLPHTRPAAHIGCVIFSHKHPHRS